MKPLLVPRVRATFLRLLVIAILALALGAAPLPAPGASAHLQPDGGSGFVCYQAPATPQNVLDTLLRNPNAPVANSPLDLYLQTTLRAPLPAGQIPVTPLDLIRRVARLSSAFGATPVVQDPTNRPTDLSQGYIQVTCSAAHVPVAVVYYGGLQYVPADRAGIQTAQARGRQVPAQCARQVIQSNTCDWPYYRVADNMVGRASGIVAVIAPGTTGQTNAQADPPGFAGAPNGTRGHLYAASFGGSNDDPRNFVMLYARTNSYQSARESRLNNALNTQSWERLVFYNVLPRYRGQVAYPPSVDLNARGLNRYRVSVILFNEEDQELRCQRYIRFRDKKTTREFQNQPGVVTEPCGEG
jgi:hypothetical protein